jgi:hypothetical protein
MVCLAEYEYPYVRLLTGNEKDKHVVFQAETNRVTALASSTPKRQKQLQIQRPTPGTSEPAIHTYNHHP